LRIITLYQNRINHQEGILDQKIYFVSTIRIDIIFPYMPKKDRLPYELRRDAASHIPKEDWDNMTKEQQDEYLRRIFE
jgi:hypothetical protein